MYYTQTVVNAPASTVALRAAVNHDEIPCFNNTCMNQTKLFERKHLRTTWNIRFSISNQVIPGSVRAKFLSWLADVVSCTCHLYCLTDGNNAEHHRCLVSFTARIENRFLTDNKGLLSNEHWTHTFDESWQYSPLSAVGMAGMTFVVGFGVLEDETVCTLQTVGTLFHTIRTVLEMEALHTVLRPLQILGRNKLMFKTYK